MFYVHVSVQFEKRHQVQRGKGDSCHSYRFFAVSLSLCICLSLRLLVFSVGVGVQGLVYGLNPVALKCQESELSVGFMCA